MGAGEVAKPSEPPNFETELVARGKLKYYGLHNARE